MRFQRTRPWVPVLLVLPGLAIGCAGTGKQRVVTDRQPTADVGVGATILYPGQSVPMPSRPGERAGSPSGSNMSWIGGATQEVWADRRVNEELGTKAASEMRRGGSLDPEEVDGDDDGDGEWPLWVKVVAAPFALVAWPFVKVGEAIAGDDDEDQAGAAAPAAGPQAAATPLPPVDPQADWERRQLESMEAELARRAAGAPPAGTAAPAPSAPPSAAPPRAAAAPSRRLSIAEELAALQASVAPRPRPEAVAAGAASPPRADAAPAGLADRVRDRNGDGRPDQWVYHEADGRPTRELLDEDGDGAPDRTVWFDPATAKERRIEEDTNLDGRIDTWVELEAGRMVRQRRDTDFDGFLDTWSFYRDGVLARQEQDRSGDGFRDRVTFYERGRLVREREDADGDGRIDRVTLYDAEERVVRRDEDTNADGLVDVRSHYENGRLARRELVSDRVGIEEEELTSAAWSSGEDEDAPEPPNAAN